MYCKNNFNDSESGLYLRLLSYCDKQVTTYSDGWVLRPLSPKFILE